MPERAPAVTERVAVAALAVIVGTVLVAALVYGVLRLY